MRLARRFFPPSHYICLISVNPTSLHLTADAEEDDRGMPRRRAATTIDTTTAEEDVEDFDVPEIKI